MNLQYVKTHIDAYNRHHQVLDAARYLLRVFGLEHPNLSKFDYQQDVPEGQLLLTAVGSIPGKQVVYIPENLFDFDLPLVLNLLAHEMLHVRQKAEETLVEDKNEREWQAYTEMLFHKHFPHVPEASDFHRKQFAQKALLYYDRMGSDSALQKKYIEEKLKVEQLLAEIEKKLNS